jgi:phage tail sheath protein FI
MGARTLSADTLWIFVPVRRAMIFLRRVLRHSMAWVVFEPNGPALNAMLTTAVGTLLLDVFESGGLAGDSPDQAFYLTIDQSAAAAGELLMDIGVALTKPAEFVTVRVSRTANALELTEIPVRVEAGQS